VSANLVESADAPVVVGVRNVSKVYGMWSSPRARLAFPLLNNVRRAVPLPWLGLGAAEKRMKDMYREFYALRDISFEIRKGESWGFVGVNGSGKSTLLKIISGNLRPSAGSVEVEGKVAILDYSAGFNGEFTGRENVYLKASILGLSRRDVDKRFDSIAAFADIGDFIEQPVKTYSSGMSARLGFAIMAHVDAEILITDEALAVGDAFFVQKCMTHIHSFLRKGTFLFVSHSVSDVLALCRKAVWLERGVIRAIGSAKDVTDAYLASVSLKGSRKFLSDTSVEAPEVERGRRPDDETPDALATEGDLVLRQPELSRLTHSRTPRAIKDPRLEFLNRSPWRNDVEIPDFSPETGGFGVGGAKIENVLFADDSGAQLTWIIGAEMVRLQIELRAERDLGSPIVGFQFKDRLGQSLFADNTYLITLEKPFSVRAGERFGAEFRFQLPLLPIGDYAIRVAVAEGMEHDHAMMHCIDNALVFRCTTPGARHGLVGVPMQHIKIGLLGPGAEA
jgi:lipopolysaccharide transport system ATP-binding protein